jgi:DNA-binding NarL/FixJ family response regulator
VSVRALRVLLAEEDPVAREGTVHTIQLMSNLEAYAEAASCAEAVEKARTFKPHIVVLSAKLPVMEALNAVQEIKQLSPNIHILLLSSSDTQPLTQELERIGGDGWATPALLLSSIETAQQSELLFLDDLEN